MTQAHDVLYGITWRADSQSFEPFTVHRYPGIYGAVWRISANDPPFDVGRNPGAGMHETEAEAWRAWKRWIARLACSAKRQLSRHVETLRLYRDKP